MDVRDEIASPVPVTGDRSKLKKTDKSKGNQGGKRKVSFKETSPTKASPKKADVSKHSLNEFLQKKVGDGKTIQVVKRFSGKPKPAVSNKRKLHDESSSDESSSDEDSKIVVVDEKQKKEKKKVKKEKSQVKTLKKNKVTEEQLKKNLYLEDFPPLLSRTVPSSLFATIRDAQVDMKTFLEEIGFASLHSVNIDTLPNRLARFVVRAFDSSTYQLKLNSGVVQVTPEKIHEILGLPVGGKSLFDFPKRDINDEFVSTWVKQFHPNSYKDIRVSHVASKLVLAKEVDFMFKVNFLVLFSNVMGTAHTMKALIDLTVVRHITADMDISSIDWCGFIHRCLSFSTEPKTVNGFYIGPLCLLILMYLDSTKFDRFPVIRLRPAIKNWTTSAMNVRQELEISEEAFGKLELQDEWSESEVHQTEGFYDVGKLESAVEKVEMNDKKSFCNAIGEKLSSLSSEKVKLENLFLKAVVDYPNDDDVLQLFEDYKKNFKETIELKEENNLDKLVKMIGMTVDEKPKEDVAKEMVDKVVEKEMVEEDKETVVEKPKKKKRMTKKKDVEAESYVIQYRKEVVAGEKTDDVGEKTEKNVGVGEKVVVAGEKAEKVGNEQKIDAEMAGKSFEVELQEEGLQEETFTQWIDSNINWYGEVVDIIVDEYHQDKTSGIAVTETISSKKVDDAKKTIPTSPYVYKKTDVTSQLNKIEFIIGNSLFFMQGEKFEIVFEIKQGCNLSAVRINMETLAPKLWIDASVLDCWASILNHEEIKTSKRKHIFPSGCITQAMVNGTVNEDKHYEMFESAIGTQFSDDPEYKTLCKIGWAMFPMCMSSHFYVVCFNLKNPTSMLILDNSIASTTYSPKYQAACDILKKLFAMFLRRHNHPKHQLIESLKHRIPKFKWSTTKNGLDCGVFAMIHLEQFDGQPISKFDCGLCEESPKQVSELMKMRFKIATKILLHNCNIHRQMIFKQAVDFEKKYDKRTKISMIVNAIKNRNDRDPQPVSKGL